MKKRVARERKVVKAVKFDRGEQVFVGVDVHKRTHHVAVFSSCRGLLSYWTQPAKPESLVEKLSPFRQHVARVVYEAGPTGYGLVRALHSAGIKADVIAPGSIPRPPVAQGKSDRLDCRKLAEYACKGMLRAVCVPDQEEEADRQVVRLRWRLADKSREVKAQIKSFLLVHGLAEPEGLERWARQAVVKLRGLELGAELRFCLDVLLDEMEHAEGQVARLTEKLKELEQSERHRADAAVLRSAPGVGLITAMTFKVELVAPERFQEPREVSLMQGLAPQVYATGETRREGHLMNSGNRYLRTVLVEAAWRWIRLDARAAGKYRRLVANTGSSKQAIVGMARRLGIILWRMLTRAEKYRGFVTEKPARAG